MQRNKSALWGLNPENPHLPHTSNEIAGQPPHDALNDEMARESAVRNIRDLLANEADRTEYSALK